jgi:hypothetical protein
LGIPVITVIYSWDNLPKARLNVVADKYLVWSNYMKEEMGLYYPEISQEKVLVCGTPQFEFYMKKNLIIERRKFATHYGLDENKKWILFSGGDTRTSPFDPNYLNDLLLALKGESNIQVIFRRSPADFSNRFDEVIVNHSGKLIVIDPAWQNKNNWAHNIPLIEDFNLLVNIAEHCELAINVGSTIAHDFANFNKPTIYINYDSITNTKWSVKMVNNFQHFKSMPSKNSVVWINHMNEWVDKIKDTIEQPNNVALDRITWYNKINLVDKISASEKIANLLLK